MAADRAISDENGFILTEALLLLLICGMLALLAFGWALQQKRYERVIEGGWKNEEMYRILKQE